MHRAIELAGGVGALAKRLGVAYQAVQRWRNEGIPAERVLEVCAAVGWNVTPHQMAEHLYPNPGDGIPPGIRAKPKKNRAA